MTKPAYDVSKKLQDSLFPNAEPLEARPVDMVDTQQLLFKKSQKAKSHRARMPRLIDDLRRGMVLRFVALAVAASAAGYGTYGLCKDYGKKLGEARHTRFMNSVSEGKEEAEKLYAARDTKVKMVEYILGESEKKGRGIFATYESPLIMDYDTTGNGEADLRVYRTVDPEIFLGWEEGDVANEKFGSWKRYSHPLNDVLKETRDGKGTILNLNNGKMVKFGGGSRQ